MIRAENLKNGFQIKENIFSRRWIVCLVSSIFSTVYAAPELSTEELHQVLDEPMKGNQQVKEERSSRMVPFDTKHTIFVFGDKKLKDVKSERELKQLIQQADDITYKNSRWLCCKPY